MHRAICLDLQASTSSSEKGCFYLGSRTRTSIQLAQASNDQSSHTRLTKLQHSIHLRNWCLCLWSGCSTHAARKTTCFLQQMLGPKEHQQIHLLKGGNGHPWSFKKMATLFPWKPTHHSDRSAKSKILKQPKTTWGYLAQIDVETTGIRLSNWIQTRSREHFSRCSL